MVLNGLPYPGMAVDPRQLTDGFILAPGKKYQAMLKKITAIAEFDCPVLITGESGTGKELIARAVHFHGARRDRPFLPVNCAALNNDLMGSQLFGHLRGAFTGAVSQNPGLIRAAEGGTMFLDEISTLSLSAQAQLLRFLESGEILPVGGTHVYTADVRILAASNEPLAQLCKAGKFRHDLFQRLNVYPLYTVPLRAEKEAIRSFTAIYLEQFSQKYACRDKYFARPVRDFFHLYDWPGNVRELMAIVLRGLINSGRAKKISLRHLELELDCPEELAVSLEGDWQTVQATVEYRYLVYQLKKCRGNQRQLSRISRKSKNFIRQRLQKFSINPRAFR